MRGAIIHGVLLAVMLVYGYRTWTRDKTIGPNVGSVVLWDSGDVASIEYKAPKKIVKLERKADYWWGVDTTIETRVKPKPETSQGSGAGSAAGSAAGSGAGSALSLPPPPEEEEVGRKTSEFPLGDSGDKLVKNFDKAHALRDLGKPSDEEIKKYKLDNAKTTITVTFANGSKREFLVGDAVYGGGDKYVLDKQSGKAYVLSRELLSGLEVGEQSLHLTDPRGFDFGKVDRVVIDAAGKSKTGLRVESAGTEGGKVKTWGDAETKKPNQTLGNFIDNASKLVPIEYASQLKIADLTQVLRMTWGDDRGRTLGTLTLYKHAKPGAVAPGTDFDPANPPAAEIEYYIVTEKTRVPALVRRDQAERMENDIETVFASKGEDPGKSKVDPTKNPFPDAPLPTGPTPPMPPAPKAAGSAAPSGSAH